MKYIGNSAIPTIIHPNIPSHPTPCNGGMLYPFTSFCSTVTWIAAIIWEVTIKRSPVKTEFGSLELLCPITSPRPTIIKPITTISIPTQWYTWSLLPKNATDNSAVKMITEPRSIWKLYTYVKLKPKYNADVPSTSQRAGITKIKQENFWVPNWDTS